MLWTYCGYVIESDAGAGERLLHMSLKERANWKPFNRESLSLFLLPSSSPIFFLFLVPLFHRFFSFFSWFLPFPLFFPFSFSGSPLLLLPFHPFASFSFKRTHPKKKKSSPPFFKGFFCSPLSRIFFSLSFIFLFFFLFVLFSLDSPSPF